MRATARIAIFGTLITILLICFGVGGSVTAAETTSNGQIIVTGYTLDPGVFYPGDEGILTVTLTGQRWHASTSWWSVHASQQ